jgi:hypothetical protein
MHFTKKDEKLSKRLVSRNPYILHTGGVWTVSKKDAKFFRDDGRAHMTAGFCHIPSIVRNNEAKGSEGENGFTKRIFRHKTQ